MSSPSSSDEKSQQAADAKAQKSAGTAAPPVRSEGDCVAHCISHCYSHNITKRKPIEEKPS